MRFGRVLIAIGVWLVPTVAFADGHRAGLFAGYARAAGSSLNGVIFGGEIAPAKLHGISFKSDISFTGGEHNGQDVTRIAWSAGVGAGGKISPKLAVNIHTSAGSVFNDGGKDFIFVAGFAVDWLLKDYFAVRAQLDQLVRSDGAEDFPRLSIGGVYRFPRE